MLLTNNKHTEEEEEAAAVISPKHIQLGVEWAGLVTIYDSTLIVIVIQYEAKTRLDTFLPIVGALSKTTSKNWPTGPEPR